MDKEWLMIPGPTPIPPQVQMAASQPMISHRGKAFSCLYEEIQTNLREIFGTNEEILIFPAAGTGAMEASIVNLFSEGDHVLCLDTGEFGRRYKDIGEAFGLQVETLSFPLGRPVDPKVVEDRLAKDDKKSIRGILLTHNETSAGVTNDLKAVSGAVGEHPAFLIVDAVSSLGALPVKMDEWGLDVVISGSQKALMSPPGLALAALSARAWAQTEKAGLPRYYWDFRRAKAYAEKKQTPYTPAVSLLFGLNAALKSLTEQGMEKIYDQQAVIGKAFRAGIRALGLELVARPGSESDTVTAIFSPAGLCADQWRKEVENKWHVVTAKGQGQLAGKIIRVGHMGFIDPLDILSVLGALEMSLGITDKDKHESNAIKAAQKVLAEGGLRKTCE